EMKGARPMPSPGGARRSAGWAVWVALLLAAAPGGCEWGGGSPPEGEGTPALRWRPAPHTAPANFEDRGVPPPVVPSPPVPQDPAAQERLRTARRAWLYEDTLRAYERYGRHNDRWDSAAAEALKKWARLRDLPEPRSD